MHTCKIYYINDTFQNFSRENKIEDKHYNNMQKNVTKMLQIRIKYTNI